MRRLLIGVDAGKQQHHAAAYDPGGDRVVGRLQCAVSREGFEQFRAFLTRLTENERESPRDSSEG